jgi:tripartite ATP-independent transporter DctP family solute receptor
MPLARRTFCMTAAAASLALAAPLTRAAAQTAKYRLRYGTAFPSDHPGAVRIAEAAEAIKRETNGLVDLQVFPNSQLGSEPDMFTQTRDGALDFMSTSGVNQTLVPVAGINAVAFAFPGYTQVWAAMDGELGDYVRAAFAKVNLHVFEKCLDNGYRNITSSNKPINAPADLKGFKIRVPGAQLWVTMFKALGAAPTPVNFGELYAALQTHIVDGEENPLALIQSAKLYEVQKYVSMTGHIWDGHHIFTGAKRWAALPEDVRTVISRNFAAAAVKERGDIGQLNDKAMADIKKTGVTFTEPDKQPFRDALKTAGFYAEWKGRYGDEAWAKLEKYSGAL